jgi:glycosyltransferase involved in cell wall biosynthesis
MIPNLLAVSRLDGRENYKGVDTVIRALPALISKFPTLEFEIIGDGSDRPRLEALARSLAVAPYVRFLGRVSDDELQAAYQRCDIYVMPSGAEGFGFVFIEAMAYGKPVVAARAAATPEVVKDGETGILIEYGNVTQLVDALSSLLSDPERSRQMGALGLARVTENYSYQSLKNNLALLLNAAVPSMHTAAYHA